MHDSEKQLYTAFLAMLRNERRLSPHTLDAYQHDLNHFQNYCEAQNIAGWREVNAQVIRAYVANLHRNKLNGRSIQRHLSALRKFFSWLEKERHLRANPVIGIRAPKVAKKLPATLNVDQLNQLLNAQTDNDPLMIRDMAIMELMYSSGLRLAELVNANMADLNLQQGEIQVTGKGNRQRIVPVGAKAIAAIKAWFTVRGQYASQDNPALFLSKQGKRISTRAVQARLQQWGVKKALDASLHPHQLRHSFATHMLESSGNIRAVQELLGHANLSTTQVYTHLDFQYLAQIYDKAHPKAKKTR